MAAFEGKCYACGRTYRKDHGELVVCDCWEHCPICGQKMAPYAPDLDAVSYGKDGKRDLQILRVCNNVAGHSNNSPFFSSQKPIEVELERLS